MLANFSEHGNILSSFQYSRVFLRCEITHLLIVHNVNFELTAASVIKENVEVILRFPQCGMAIKKHYGIALSKNLICKFY
ncbi:Putative protein of unknown function (plasmid) [Pseudoalteromonas carrageenovora IAM 12662]|uniref:Uncharacterized protein n=1 Tax=Pseudoalteromonas carrageenovora IAM 12662 TaxID=1314868 RepID=A0A2K4XFV9_PSEVC|nr:Putative protein of unknown function [Pseudoalteromonas carrageenovora IAM 12662]